MIGRVALVGAGPGDPGLITVRGLALLRRADVVVYDRLVDPRLLDEAPLEAQRIFAGKASGAHALSQERINALLIAHARRGHRVVRLKGGDPFVFGRGGEEAGALAAAGIPFEIVPGVSAATSAAGLAGIPVTHRGVASGFVVVSGHAEDAYRPILDGLTRQSATIVVLMGLGHIEDISTLLIARGWKAQTPAAVLFGASTAESEVWTTTLGELKDGLNVSDRTAPGTIVIGEVVRLRGAIASEVVPGEAIAR